MKSEFSSQNGAQSKLLYDRARRVITGGVSRNTIFRKPHPYYVASAKGCYVTDIDGTERLDFANNMASLIHGHSYPPIVEAVTDQLKRGTAFTMGTEAEVAFAELLNERSPGFEKIRFMNSGTEAIMTMIKAARAFTGKPKVAKAEGTYHGSYDYAEISQTSNPDNWGNVEDPNPVQVVQGTPQGIMEDMVIFPFNDIERTLQILDRHKDQLACVLIDLVPHRAGLIPATKEFIEAVYKWTRQNNALLIFDEVVTYRVDYSGAQLLYPAKPDLTALGKIIGGGFPIGAVAGRTEVMKVLDPTEKIVKHPHSGTFSANPVSMTAGRVAMEYYDAQVVDQLNELTTAAKNQLEQVFRDVDLPMSITGAGSMMRMHFRENAPTRYRDAYQGNEIKQLINYLIDYLFYEEKIITINTLSFMLSTAMRQKHIDQLTEAIDRGLNLIKPKFEKMMQLS